MAPNFRSTPPARQSLEYIWRYSSRATLASTESPKTAPPCAAWAMRASVAARGVTSKVWLMPLRPSTSASSTRLPPAARASARAAATVVLPVPPLPVTMCSRTPSQSVSRVDPASGAIPNRRRGQASRRERYRAGVDARARLVPARLGFGHGYLGVRNRSTDLARHQADSRPVG